MSRYQPMPPGGFELPPLTELTRNVLIALFVLYVVELSAANVMGLPVYALVAWQPFGAGFAPWQPITRYLVQGPGVIGVVIAGVVLYFFLPVVERLTNRRELIESLLFGMAGGTLLGLLLDLIGLTNGNALGWQVLVEVLIVMFGMKLPNAVIRLFFILPIQAKLIVWATGVISGLMLLATLDLTFADAFGTWLGTLGWWYWRGPGGRRRKLIRDANRIERELNRFQVLDGGKQGPQDDDDFVH